MAELLKDYCVFRYTENKDKATYMDSLEIAHAAGKILESESVTD